METFTELELSPEDAAAAANMRIAHAAALFRAFPEIAEDMAARPAPELSSPRFLRQLQEGTTPEEAITFAAYALQARHAVWWAHECLQTLPELLTEDDRQILSLCAVWAAEPTEDNRRTVLDAGMAARARGPGVWVALAAGWSGGSMAPADSPDVPAPEFLTGRAVNAGVLSMLARVPVEQRRRRLSHFVGMAEVLAGTG